MYIGHELFKIMASQYADRQDNQQHRRNRQIQFLYSTKIGQSSLPRGNFKNLRIIYPLHSGKKGTVEGANSEAFNNAI